MWRAWTGRALYSSRRTLLAMIIWDAVKMKHDFKMVAEDLVVKREREYQSVSQSVNSCTSWHLGTRNSLLLGQQNSHIGRAMRTWCGTQGRWPYLRQQAYRTHFHGMGFKGGKGFWSLSWFLAILLGPCSSALCHLGANCCCLRNPIIHLSEKHVLFSFQRQKNLGRRHSKFGDKTKLPVFPAP